MWQFQVEVKHYLEMVCIYKPPAQDTCSQNYTLKMQEKTSLLLHEKKEWTFRYGVPTPVKTGDRGQKL